MLSINMDDVMNVISMIQIRRRQCFFILPPSTILS